MGLRMEKWDCQGTAICRFFFYCLKCWRLLSLPPFFMDPGKTMSKGLELGKGHFHLSLMNTYQVPPEICGSCSNAVTLVSQRGPKSHVSTEEIRAVATVFQRDARTTLGSYCGLPFYPPCLG